MLTALLDGAGDGRSRPRLREVSALAALSVRLRFGAPGASAKGVFTGEVVRRVVLVWFTFQAAVGTVAIASAAQQNVRMHVGVLGPGLLEFAGMHLDSLMPVLLASALLLGLRRVAWVACAGSLLVVAHTVWSLPQAHVWDPRFNYDLYTDGSLALSILITLSVFPAFHRTAPKPTGRQWWFAAWIGGALAAWLAWQIFAVRLPEALGLADAGAVAFGVWKARISPSWPIALSVASLSALLSSLSITGIGTSSLGPQLLLLVTASATAVLTVASLASVAFRRRLSVA